jgi:ankyrin repeat protein
MRALLLGLWLLGAPAWAGPLHEAASQGRAEAIAPLVQSQPGELNQPDGDGKTALLLAVSSGHPQCVEALLQAGARPNQGGAQGWTPLHEAALQGDVASAQLLLRFKADPNAREKANRGTPLHVAAFQGQLEIARLLVRAGANVNARDNEGLTPLFHAKDQAHPQLAQMLRAAGAR